MKRIRCVPLLTRCAGLQPNRIRYRLCLALVPFTGPCSPILHRARECKCGSWVMDGDASCSSCGDPAPVGRSTSVWVREYFNEIQWDEFVKNHPEYAEDLEDSSDVGVRIPQGRNPHEYIVEAEAEPVQREEYQRYA